MADLKTGNFLGFRQVTLSYYSGLSDESKKGYFWLIREKDASGNTISSQINYGTRKYADLSDSAVSKLSTYISNLTKSIGETIVDSETGEWTGWMPPSGYTIIGESTSVEDALERLETYIVNEGGATKEEINDINSAITVIKETQEAQLDLIQDLDNKVSGISEVLETKADADDVYTKDETDDLISKKISTLWRFKGEVDSVEDLPTGATEGDVYKVGNDEYAFDGKKWVKLGPVLDGLAKQEDLDAVEGRVETLEDEVSGISETLETKANQSDLDALSDKVDTIDGEVSALTTEVATKASKDELNDLTETVGELANDINKKANQEDLNDLTDVVSGISDTVSGMALDIAAMDEDIDALSDSVDKLGENSVSKIERLDATGMTNNDTYALENASGDIIDTFTVDYNPALADSIQMTSQVGGLSGKTVADLSGYTISDLLNEILFPETLPDAATVPGISVTKGSVSSTAVTLGSTIKIGSASVSETTGKFKASKYSVPAQPEAIYTHTSALTSNKVSGFDEYTATDGSGIDKVTVSLGKNEIDYKATLTYSAPSNLPLTSYSRTTATTSGGTSAIWTASSKTSNTSTIVYGVYPVYTNISVSGASGTLIDTMYEIPLPLTTGNTVTLGSSEGSQQIDYVPAETKNDNRFIIYYPSGRTPVLYVKNKMNSNKYEESLVKLVKVGTKDDVEINKVKYTYDYASLNGSLQGEGDWQIKFVDDSGNAKNLSE